MRCLGEASLDVLSLAEAELGCFDLLERFQWLPLYSADMTVLQPTYPPDILQFFFLC